MYDDGAVGRRGDSVTVEKCFKQITIAVQGTPVRQRVKKLIAHGQIALCNMRKLAAEMTDKRTILAHQHMTIEDERPIPLNKSAPRSSVRHAKSVLKRKFSELDNAQLLSSLQDLHQSGRLSRPIDVCKVIHGDDSPAQKKRRSTIFKIVCQEFEICNEGTLRNAYSRYRKFLNKQGPALSNQFGARGRPIISSKEFRQQVAAEIQMNPHQQKDLRKVTEKVLQKRLAKRNKDADLCEAMPSQPSKSVVDKYVRMATTCANVEQVGKVKHSTKVCMYI